MGFRLGLGVGCVGVICALLGACGQSTTDNDEGNGTGGTGEAGTGGASGVPSLPPHSYTGDCSGLPVDTECLSDECPVGVDFSVRCDVRDWAVPTLAVAPRADRAGAFLAVGGLDSAWFVSLEQDATTLFTSLPPYAGESFALSVGPAGDPWLMGAEEDPSLIDPLAEPLSELPMTVPDDSLRLFTHDADGTLHLDYLSDADTLTRLVRPAGSQEFEESSTVPWGTADWATATSAGSALLFALEYEAGVYLTLDSGSGPVALSEPIPNATRWITTAAPAIPLDASAGTDDFAIGMVHADRLYLWAGLPNAWTQTTVPLTPLTRQCWEDETGDAGDCPDQPCEQASEGVDPATVSLARTADGRLWAAWLYAFVDETQKYTLGCSTDDATICACPMQVTRGGTRAELVLVELDPLTGAAREALRVATADVEPSEAGNGSPLMRMSTLGNELALALRVKSSDGDPRLAHLRVLELDTSGL
ncbi:MAG TPA: hypothetical protein VLC09_15350 [Polyangiaceae bacterium]|nr:hypothetical protein [Polyangiaceae bacterium]